MHSQKKQRLKYLFWSRNCNQYHYNVCSTQHLKLLLVYKRYQIKHYQESLRQTKT